MKKQLLQVCTLFAFIIGFSLSANAKVWRVNNTVGTKADFSSFYNALKSTSILPGDTVYVEGSQTDYDAGYLTKRLVIIGPGYFLGANENPGLQYNGYKAWVQIMLSDSLASGSKFIGISGTVNIHPTVDNIEISRCNVSLATGFGGTEGSLIENLTVTKSFVSLYSNAQFTNLYLTNNIVFNYGWIPNAKNSIIRNNVFTAYLETQESYISNNIFTSGSTLKFANCTVKYNISVTNNLPSDNNNQNNKPFESLFVQGSSPDGKYILKAGSPAIGAGEPINGVTPDAGAFGTADPYRISGIPAIPTIYQLTVPENVSSTATKMTVTFSTRSNN